MPDRDKVHVDKDREVKVKVKDEKPDKEPKKEGKGAKPWHHEPPPPQPYVSEYIEPKKTLMKRIVWLVAIAGVAIILLTIFG